tara:strand:- start:638 stop:2914 length:2277 start_codon:yes stop_codon:yes gene_type:complete
MGDLSVNGRIFSNADSIDTSRITIIDNSYATSVTNMNITTPVPWTREKTVEFKKGSVLLHTIKTSGFISSATDFNWPLGGHTWFLRRGENINSLTWNGISDTSYVLRQTFNTILDHEDKDYSFTEEIDADVTYNNWQVDFSGSGAANNIDDKVNWDIVIIGSSLIHAIGPPGPTGPAGGPVGPAGPAGPAGAASGTDVSFNVFEEFTDGSGITFLNDVSINGSVVSNDGELGFAGKMDIGGDANDGYTFTGNGLDGTTYNPTIYLMRGSKYKFINTTGGHIIGISSQLDIPQNDSYNKGFFIDGITATFNVPQDAPDELYYYCTSLHTTMKGTLKIVGQCGGSGNDASFNNIQEFTDGSGITFLSDVSFNNSVDISGTLAITGGLTVNGVSISSNGGGGSGTDASFNVIEEFTPGAGITFLSDVSFNRIGGTDGSLVIMGDISINGQIFSSGGLVGGGGGGGGSTVSATSTSSTTYTNSKYTVHKFNGNGTLNVVTSGLIEYIIVGGGGGGGKRHAGAGGGGGVVQGEMEVAAGDSYSVVIGAGGSGASGYEGSPGSPTTFGSITAYPGGGGRSNFSNATPEFIEPVQGTTYATDYYYNRLATTGGTNVASGGWVYPHKNGSQGYRGGRGNQSPNSNAAHVGGGGGGAGGPGADAVQGTNTNQGGADGGIGRLVLGLGANDENEYFGGGGGGDLCSENTGQPGTGGLGGGGDGGKGVATAQSGTANTGGGGGGAGFTGGSNGVSGDGGSGTVIIRYLV